MMTPAEICADFGWSNEMVHRFLQGPDVPVSLRGKHKCELYGRDRVLAQAETEEARHAKRQWDETLRGSSPNPGWTTRLGDIGDLLGISAIAVGKILELIGYRFDKLVTNRAIAAKCGVRRWDGFALHSDWHPDGVLAAIRSAVETSPVVADGLATAVFRQQGKARAAAYRVEQEEIVAASLRTEEALISELLVELRALRASDPSMSLLTSVEYTTPDPAHRVTLYRHCSAEHRIVRFSSSGQGGQVFASIASSVAKDIALLERRARAEGFQV